MMELRPYQQAAVDAFWEYLRERDDNPCIVIPTAGGKTPVIATVCKDAVTRWNGRVLILAHVKELLEQTADKLQKVCPEVPYGIYSAGLKRRDMRQPVIVAGIQSIYKKACDFDPFDLVLVDEAHLIPTAGDGMYQTFLKDAKKVNPDLRIGGLTATPYRLDVGLICGENNILNDICYEVGVKELIVDGYISKVTSKHSPHGQIDTSDVTVRGGEFIASELEDAANKDELVEAACEEIVAKTQDRKAILIFTSGIDHGKHVCQVLQDKHGIFAPFVCGDTPSEDRRKILEGFKEGRWKYLVNVNVLTTGFDAPNIDCVVLLRATLSPGLYGQMVGRGFRLYPGKENCLVLDFGGNVLRHGPVDMIRPGRGKAGAGGGKEKPPAKACPECGEIVATATRFCPACNYEWVRDPNHDRKADNASILSGEVTEHEYTVNEVTYHKHKKHNDPDAKPTLRVDYHVGFHQRQSEWICFEHTGFARGKAVKWWSERSSTRVPKTIDEAIDFIMAGAIAKPTKIKVRSVSGQKYDRIIGYTLGEIPGPIELGDAHEGDNFGKVVPADDDFFGMATDSNQGAWLAPGITEADIPW